GRCTANIVLFARGTTETGTLGITVGPALSSGLTGRDWSVVGVAYDADFKGDNCLGLPGGQVMKDYINQAAEKCPNSKLFVSGYSEGGMVSHNGVAYANPEAVKKVAAVVVFGDPFQGAPIKGYSGPIITFCKDGDSVCTGNFVISMAHLAY
ncbi:alpha/beta-hydrolase, partial [Trichodelitschia bisporula]